MEKGPELAGNTVVFVLGGPGVGKGTQCLLLAKRYGFVHLSAGDLLRAERAREGSQVGSLIESCMREGQIVPSEITIGLLRDAMKRHLSEPRGERPMFLIDGFPRKVDQAKSFEEHVCPCTCVLFLECSKDEILLDRIVARARGSGAALRVDDNSETAQKRIIAYRTQTMPVIEMYRDSGKLRVVACDAAPDAVFENVCKVITEDLKTLP